MTLTAQQQRLKAFTYWLVSLCEALPSKKNSKIFEDQLLRPGFSAAVNYRAACKGQSKKAFKAKLSIAFEVIDESLFWLEAISDLKLILPEKIELLIKEADELTRILAANRKKLEEEEGAS